MENNLINIGCLKHATGREINFVCEELESGYVLHISSDVFSENKGDFKSIPSLRFNHSENMEMIMPLTIKVYTQMILDGIDSITGIYKGKLLKVVK